MIVVRPSGVWNSRAPLHNFIYQSHLISQTYGLLTCTIGRTRYDAEHLAPESPTSARRFMRGQISGRAAAKGWATYRDSWQCLNAKYDQQPSIKNVELDLATSLYAIRDSTVVRYSALFEAFVQCWFLNMILAKLESGTEITATQEQTAELFSPVGKMYVVIPGVPAILGAFPDIKESLKSLPHITTDPVTGATVEIPAISELNAWRTVLFWRNYRNHLVHRGSRISNSFSVAHAEFFEHLRAPFGTALRPLKRGARLQLPDFLYYAMLTTHNKVAIWLNSVLQDISGKSRGCIRPLGSGLPEPKKFDALLRPRALLLQGDHAESLAWVDQFTMVPELENDSEAEDAHSATK